MISPCFHIIILRATNSTKNYLVRSSYSQSHRFGPLGPVNTSVSEGRIRVSGQARAISSNSLLIIIRRPGTGFKDSSMISRNLSAWVASYCLRITSGLIFIVIPFAGILAMTVKLQPRVQALAFFESISSFSRCPYASAWLSR